jgi:hypothetical protein
MNLAEKTRNQFVKEANSGKKRLSPLRAIKMFCWECMGYAINEVKDCQGEDCPLYKFRFGKNLTKSRGNTKVNIP